MVTRALILTGEGETVALESYEFLALQGASGFGLPPVSNRWVTGAGHGSTWQGAQAGRRVIPLPTLIRAPDVDTLEDTYGRLAIILSPDAGPATLTLDEGTRGAWACQVVRESGGDYVTGQDTNGSSWLALPDLTLTAGDPRWTRTEPVAPYTLRPAGENRGLLSGPRADGGYGEGLYGAGPYGIGGTTSALPGWSLTRLRLKSGQALGPVILHNPGTATGVLRVTAVGPATYLGLRSPDGDLLEWSGNMLEGQHRVIDFAAGTVTDQDGVNRYDELGGVPVFWEVPRGSRTAEVTMEGTNATTSSVTLAWYPRRWVVIP